ncbi:MAG: hypothetical protein CMM48_01120 [Rhodospirillaceae bacterium]|nr:hypothetical protein [Rhodospirillaceae bacterium]|tara:strand:+ start:400 stop:771 length:372 start_codon:yes stop_codon:yes gene_type:complete
MGFDLSGDPDEILASYTVEVVKEGGRELEIRTYHLTRGKLSALMERVLADQNLCDRIISEHEELTNQLKGDNPRRTFCTFHSALRDLYDSEDENEKGALEYYYAGAVIEEVYRRAGRTLTLDD